MNDLFQSLVNDALQYALQQPKDGFVLGSAEEVQFFKSVPQPRKEIVPQPAPRKVYTPEKTVAPPQRPQQRVQTPEPVKPKTAPVVAETPNKDRILKPSDEIRKVLQKIAPALHITDSVSDDAQAKQIATGWKEWIANVDVVLLVLDSSPDMLELMKNMAKAIQKELGSPKIIAGDRLEQEKRWSFFLEKNAFRLIIASPGLEKYPELLKLYKALPAQEAAFLGSTPLLLLSPAHEYKQAAEKKLELWKKICLMLKR